VRLKSKNFNHTIILGLSLTLFEFDAHAESFSKAKSILKFENNGFLFSQKISLVRKYIKASEFEIDVD